MTTPHVTKFKQKVYYNNSSYEFVKKKISQNIDLVS